MAETSNPLRRRLLGASAALFAVGTLLFAFAPEQEQIQPAGDDAAVRRVTLHRVALVAQPIRAEVAGVLEARRSVVLFAETRGPVTAIGAEALDRVEAGQLLVQIDPLQAEVAVERAEAGVARTRSELALARSNLERREGLAEQGVASDADLDDARNAAKVAAAALRQARAELTQARDDLAKKTILAPFAGVLRTFDVEVGEYARDGDRLGELLDVSAARVILGLSDREVVSVTPGQAVEARVDARGGETFRGEILRVGAASDPETRKFPVEVELPNPDGRLLPGMIATLQLEFGRPEPRMLIPAEATVEEFGLHFVWVVEEEEGLRVARQRRVDVRPVPFEPERVEVLSGLAEGDEVALTATRQLAEGEPVLPSESSPR